MKKNKGFTLIEILAVVTIIGLIFILVIPKITTSLKNKKSDVDTTTTNLVLSATKLYVSDHSSKFEKTDGNVSCMPLRELVNKGYLDGPVKNVTDDKDITNGKSVRITYNKGFKYELVDSNACKVYYCKSDYCDNDGNGYTEVAYLENKSNQWIDTKIIPNGSLVTQIKFQTNSAKKFYIGTRDEYDIESINYRLVAYNNAFLLDIGYGVSGTNDNHRLQTPDYNLEAQKIYEIKFGNRYIYNLSNDIKSEGTKLDESLFDYGQQYTIKIFNYLPAQASDPSGSRLFYCKIYDNDTLIRDFIPVINSTNRPCLFDKVEKKCYYNQGTGEFLWG